MKYLLILVVGQCHSLRAYMIPVNIISNLESFYSQDYRWIDGDNEEGSLGYKLKNEWAEYQVETTEFNGENTIVGILHVNE